MTVLALEFRGVRETADFGFLDEVTRVDPISGHGGAPLTVRAQAEQLARDRVGLVLAYCSCAALGAHVAELARARLVLIDPDAVARDSVWRDFARLCSAIGAHPPATAAQDDWETVFSTVREDLAQANGGDDLAYEMVDDLFARYRAWLRFLAASASAPPAAPAGEVTVIAGRPLPDLGLLLRDPARARLTRVSPSGSTLAWPAVRERLRREVSRPWTGDSGPADGRAASAREQAR